MRGRWIGLSAAVGAGALLLTVVGSTAVLAEGRDDWRGDRDWQRRRDIERDRRDVREDIRDYRRDQSRLRELEAERRHETREGDWRAARYKDAQIDRLRRDMARDRRDIHQDVSDIRRDRYDRHW
jgi:hypothetical protein